MEENETADPIDIGLLGSDAVAFNAQMPTDAVEQFPRGRWSRTGRRVFQNAKGRLPPVVEQAAKYTPGTGSIVSEPSAKGQEQRGKGK